MLEKTQIWDSKKYKLDGIETTQNIRENIISMNKLKSLKWQFYKLDLAELDTSSQRVSMHPAKRLRIL